MSNLYLPKQIPLKIIHIDMDCFYAAVEMRDNPKLKNVPMAIGSNSRRSVLCTSNYLARKFGVRSAMPAAQALKLCPELVFVRPNFKKYKEISYHIREIFSRFTDTIETVSLDEAYLDLTNTKHFLGSASLVAKEIRRLIEKETGLTASAGIAPNKFLAKIASDWNKPNNQFVITPQMVDLFCEKLPLGKISGVGKVTREKLAKLGIFTGGDLRKLSLTEANQFFGKFGKALYFKAHGIDNRRLEPYSIRKSMSVETTFSYDKKNVYEVIPQFTDLIDELEQRYYRHMEKHPDTKVKGIGVKMKLNNFKSSTADKAIPLNGFDGKVIQEIGEELLKITHQRNPLPFRLIGVGLKFESEEKMVEKQLKLL